MIEPWSTVLRRPVHHQNGCPQPCRLIGDHFEAVLAQTESCGVTLIAR
jgi:hypothetical protein